MRGLLIAGAAVACMAPAAPCWSDNPPSQPGAQVLGEPIPDTPAAPTPAWTKWFNPETAPFIPVPLISADPNSGLTLGLIPTWVTTDDHHDVSRIVAPDVLYNPNFGFGVHARIFSFSSADEQWSMVAGIKQRVEREFDGEYQIGRSREDRWTISYSAIYDRDGTTRFFGIGNHQHLG